MTQDIIENALKELKTAQKEVKNKLEELYKNTTDAEEKIRIESFFKIYNELDTAIENRDIHEIYKLIQLLEQNEYNS